MTDPAHFGKELDERLAIAAAGDVAGEEFRAIESLAAADLPVRLRLEEYRRIAGDLRDIGAAGRSLPAGFRDRVLALVDRTAGAHDAASGTAAAAAVEPRPAGRVFRLDVRKWAVAAALVAGIATAWVGVRSAVRTPDERLVAAADDVRPRGDAALRGFVPLSAAQLAAVAPRDTPRLRLLGPVGATPSNRPEILWEAVPDVARWTFVLRDEGGAELARREIEDGPVTPFAVAPKEPASGRPSRAAGEPRPLDPTAFRRATWLSLDLPLLEPGRSYRWTLEPAGPRATAGTTATFTVLADADAASLRAVADLLAAAPGESSVLRAHLALGRDPPVLGEALAWAREAVAAREALADETLRHVLIRLAEHQEVSPGR